MKKFKDFIFDRLPRCESCQGLGGFTKPWKRYSYEPCHTCYTTGLRWRWLIRLIMLYYYWFDPQMLPQFGNDGFDPFLNPPAPWSCRACNGIGGDYYGYDPCEVCGGDGLRWKWVRPVRKVWNGFWTWKARQDADKPLSEDEIPF